MKVCITPTFGGEDKGDGGVRQVISGMREALPAFGVELVDDPEMADVINCHMTAPENWINRYGDKAWVGSTHGAYWAGYQWENWALKANEDVMRLVMVSDIATAPSEWVAQAMRRHTLRDVRVVPHGVSWPYEPAENRGYVLWNKTRPDPICDPRPVNDVARLLPHVPFVTTFGDEAPNVAVTGRLPHKDAVEAVRQAGVYLCTTRETFGVGTLEALAAGVPVVGYNWGGQREFIQHGVDGWLVEPGDLVGLAEGIEWALQERGNLTPACRAKAEGFTWKRAAEIYAGIYAEALAMKTRKAPKVSVIVTAYKLDAYMDDCLQSVANQTLADFECVVVDDHSPDRCSEIADAWARKDKRFKAVHNATNLYLSGARNAGFDASTGRYVLPLDADDQLPPQALELLASALDADRTIDIAYGSVEFIDEEDGGRRWHSEWPVDFRLDWQLKGPGQLLPYASMMRRRVWELTGGYRERCRSSEDQDLWLRAPSYGFRPAKVTNADCLWYLQRKGSMSGTQGWRDHRGWYPWTQDISLAPAGAVTPQQLPIPACDPPMVAVIIPVGPGHEKLVIDAVDSVDAQTLRQWECIVVNDTGGELPRLPSWVRVIDNDGPKGVAAARNAGIAASQAPLFLPLDADDYLQPDALRLLYEAQKRTGDVIYPDFWEDPKDEGDFTPWGLPDYEPEKLLTHGCLHTVTALTPKTVWEAVGGYDETLPAWEDWAFQLQVADKGICSRRMAAPLFTYRKHTGTRRNENFANFDESKSGILSRFKDFWSGGKKPMACSSCAKRATITPPAVARTMTFSAMAPAPTGEDVVRVQYTGASVGKRRYKGDSGTIYAFDAGEPPRWVLRRDYESFFKFRADFELVPEETTVEKEALTAPVLVAEGPPA